MADRRLRAWFLAGILSAGSLAGCGGESPLDGADNEAEIVEPVTDVSHTEVKRQSIGNCWAYAACGWAEALHRARSGQDINISESWITFWDWYGKITTGRGVSRNATTMRAELETGGWWDGAMTILRARGVVYESEFIPEEAMAARSTRQSEALAAMNTALNTGGALATDAARRDPALVLNTLLTAWRVGDSVKAEIIRVFGERGSLTLSSTRVTNRGFFRRLEQIPVTTAVYSSGQVRSVNGTLADVIPYGRYGWRSISYPTSTSQRASTMQRVMRALNARQPVLISWLVDFNAMRGGRFQLSALTSPGRQGGHLTSMEDYEVVIRQPGMPERTLPAGMVASAEDQGLAVRYGTLSFIRIKNSWGTADDPSGTGFPGGYHDLYADYLNGPITWTADMSQRTPLSSVIVPAGF